LGAGTRGASFGEAMPDARDLMTAHGVRHDTLATSSREESWADLAYPRDDRGDGSFYGAGAGGGLSSSQVPAYPLSEAERQAEEWDKAQVRVLVDDFVLSPTPDWTLAMPRHVAVSTRKSISAWCQGVSSDAHAMLAPRRRGSITRRARGGNSSRRRRRPCPCTIARWSGPQTGAPAA